MFAPKLDPDFYRTRRPTEVLPRTIALSDAETPPPERWLQQIWRHQRIWREGLLTTCNQPIQILHPGFWNREPGPDFRNAWIQIGALPAASGDVEIDIESSAWWSHRHQINPAYQRVILHVIWDKPSRPPSPDAQRPILSLKPHLDAPLNELAAWLDDDARDLLPENLAGQCQAPLRTLDPPAIRELLRQAAQLRLDARTQELDARARRVGWDQTLWEAVFMALGYKHNPWPMRRIIESLGHAGRLPTPQSPNPPPTPNSSPSISLSPAHHLQLEWQARILRLSGLLPIQAPSHPARHLLRQLWDVWWRERDAWVDQILPPSAWRLAGVRPANHPLRRLALGALWLADARLPALCSEWIATPGAAAPSAQLLCRLLQPSLPHPFWTRYCTFRSPALRHPQTLLGPPRTTDLAMNAILPWLRARAQRASNQTLLQTIESRYFSWPAAQENSVLRLARQRLLGKSNLSRNERWSAAEQQGLLQIVRDFCNRTNALCASCAFPALVDDARAATSHPRPAQRMPV